MDNTDENLIAPCGMNCSLCISYQFKKNDLNRHGFHRKYCPGCIPRGKNCLFMANSCELMRDGAVRYCYECGSFPCKRLKALDKRYRTKYGMSMIENLKSIKENGINEFMAKEKQKWSCPKCGELMCCHAGYCLCCDIGKLGGVNKPLKN
jgi:hypothetical protein